jgi:hypothetical protein
VKIAEYMYDADGGWWKMTSIYDALCLCLAKRLGYTLSSARAMLQPLRVLPLRCVACRLTRHVPL